MPEPTTTASMNGWTNIIALEELQGRGKTVIKNSGKQILLICSADKIYACNNRCPHEGFPLAEGTLSSATGDDHGKECILTCNWHSWRFDLENNETIVGGDALRMYPCEVRDGDVWLDLADPPQDEVRNKALEGLRQAFDDHDYERIAREMARFQRAGGNPLDALADAFEWAMDGLEFGTTHALAAAPDWLSLRARLEGDVEQMIPVVEIIGHLSWDCLMQKGPFAYAQMAADKFDAALFEQAIEDENESKAIAQALAGLAQGGGEALRLSLQRAALAHYQAFGHSVIYLDKTYELLGQLGGAAEKALLLPLVRALCSTAREDLIPEFKAYGPALAAWDGAGTAIPEVDSFRNQGVAAALQLVSASSANTDLLYDALMQAAADAMLHYDARYRSYVDKPVQQNVDWLDFTHALTHLNAARKICAEQPQLWANALLQTGCFLGRNANFVDWQQDVKAWQVKDADNFLDQVLSSMLDHGEPLYIFPAHTLKLATALKEELALNPGATWKDTALAALNRFVNEPVKRKHMRRAVTQANKFVELEG